MNLTGQMPCQKPTAEQKKQDKLYLAWLRTMPCCVCGCSPSDPAHVRRNSGIATKPLLSAVPLCRKCHIISHAKAESGLLKLSREAAKQWFDDRAVEYYRRWLQLVNQ